jgi:hypothetical protein
MTVRCRIQIDIQKIQVFIAAIFFGQKQQM